MPHEQFSTVVPLMYDGVCDDGVSTHFDFNCEVYQNDSGSCDGARTAERSPLEKEVELLKAMRGEVDAEDLEAYISARKDSYASLPEIPPPSQLNEILKVAMVDSWKHHLARLSNAFQKKVEMTRKEKEFFAKGTKYPATTPTNGKELLIEKRKEIKRLDELVSIQKLTKEQRDARKRDIMKEISEIYQGNHQFAAAGSDDEASKRKLAESTRRESTLGKSVHSKNRSPPKYYDPNNGKEL